MDVSRHCACKVLSKEMTEVKITVVDEYGETLLD